MATPNLTEADRSPALPATRSPARRAIVLVAATEQPGARLRDILAQLADYDIVAYARFDAPTDILSTSPDLVVVDSALEQQLFRCVFAALEGQGSPPIVAFGRSADSERAAWALQSGADAWIDADASPEIVLAQVKATMRCKRTPTMMRLCDLLLDPTARSAARAGRRVQLSPKEYEVLHFLMCAAGRTVSLAELATQVWDHHVTPSADTYRHVICSLRRKLEEPGQPDLVHTVWRQGYRFGLP